LNHKNLSYYISFFDTPPLWYGELDGLIQFIFPKIDFENLETEVIPSKLRLGHKIEHIFMQLIQHSQDYRVIGHNIPIRKNKISLGEIDVILQNTDNKSYIHIELTYKFYLIHTYATIVEHQLIGPNQRDSFYAKKEKIIKHQIPLLYTREGISALKELNIDASQLGQQVCFKSQLFMPYRVGNLNLAPFNSDCIAGSWISFELFNSINFVNYNFYLPTKSEWLLVPHNRVAWLTHYEALGAITKKLELKNSPLVWVRNEDSKIEKLFIVWW